MKPSELITKKIEEILGDKYKIFSTYYFNENYTEAREVKEGENIGYSRCYTSDYGKLRKNHIIGILTMSNPVRANSNSYYLTSGYKIEFSVPRNVVITNKYGEITKEKPFDFNEDMETLVNALTNKTLQLEGDFRAKITISEPSYLLTETDGEFNYNIMQVTGNLVISNSANFGSDYKVEIMVDGNYVEVDDINTFTEMYNTDNNAIVKEGKVKVEQNLSQSGWVCTISLDDTKTENKARLLLYDIVHRNLEILNENATSEALKRKLRTKITTPSGIVHEFNAIISGSFNVDRNGVGGYSIAFTDDNKGL